MVGETAHNEKCYKLRALTKVIDLIIEINSSE